MDRRREIQLAEIPGNAFAGGNPTTILSLEIQEMRHMIQRHLTNYELNLQEVIKRVCDEAMANSGRAIESLVRDEVARTIREEVGKFPLREDVAKKIREIALDGVMDSRYALIRALEQISEEVELRPGYDATEACARARQIATDALSNHAHNRNRGIYRTVWEALRKELPEADYQQLTEIATAVTRNLEEQGLA